MSEKTKTPKAETFPIALITCCGSFDDILEDASVIYHKREQAFMSSDARDNKLPEKAASWAKASQKLIGAAGAIFHKYGAKFEEQEQALKILDIIGFACEIAFGCDMCFAREEKAAAQRTSFCHLRLTSYHLISAAPTPVTTAY